MKNNYKVWVRFGVLCIIYMGLQMMFNDHNYNERQQYNKDALIQLHIIKEEGQLLPSITWGKE